MWVVIILQFFPNLKILAMHDVIRLKQVEHVKNEKNILQVRKKSLKNKNKIQKIVWGSGIWTLLLGYGGFVQGLSQLQLINKQLKK